MYQGKPGDFITVGLPDTAVRESRERIKSSLINSGFGYPTKAVTINLAPANLRKEGAGFDLPMALGMLGAMGAPAVFVGLLLPLRQTGSLLPQLAISGYIRRYPIRKWFWVVAALVQVLMLLAIIAVAVETGCTQEHP